MTEPNTETLASALRLLYYTWGWQSAADPEKVTRIPAKAVLHRAWMPTRLQHARQAIASGVVLPPIDVHRVKVGRRVWYVLSDGNHRTAATLEAGKKTIRARVAGEMTIPAGTFVLHESGLWCAVRGTDHYQLVVWRGDHEHVLAAVKWLLEIAERGKGK